jgi:hypothetical protein
MKFGAVKIQTVISWAESLVDGYQEAASSSETSVTISQITRSLNSERRNGGQFLLPKATRGHEPIDTEERY